MEKIDMNTEKGNMNTEKGNGKRKITGMKKATIFGLFVLMFVGLLFSMNSISAYRGDYTMKGPDCTEERHEAMEAAFESLDYAAWQELMTENERHPRVVDVVTESNFETFVQAHLAGENGDHETAMALRAELGLNNGNGPGDGTGHGGGMDRNGGEMKRLGGELGQHKEQRMQQNNLADAECDCDCDNHVSRRGRGRQ